jgi:hypothetical protein
LKKTILIAVFFAAAIPAGRFAAAQTEAYPARPVRLIVAFPPGGSVDVVARLVAPRLSESLGQPVVIDNRSGASGNIGTEQAARARPDGNTLLMHTVPFVANVHLYSPLPYDPLNDFVPIALLNGHDVAQGSPAFARTVSEIRANGPGCHRQLSRGIFGPPEKRTRKMGQGHQGKAHARRMTARLPGCIGIIVA